MSQNILVRMTFPIEPLMVLSEWSFLPEDRFITVEEENISLTLWIDHTSTWWASQPTEEELLRYTKLSIKRVYVDVKLKDLPDDLVDYIIKRNFFDIDEFQKEYDEAYRQLGRKVHTLSLKYVNKLIAYFRSHKGQYWLEEYRLDEDRGFSPSDSRSASIEQMKAKTDNSDDWFLWKPPFIININYVPTSTRYINRVDWLSARDFVLSSKKTDLVLQLLSGAEALASNGHSRSAITEAVTALEIAISNFSRSANADKIFAPVLAKRMDVESLKKQTSHLGISGTVRYLFPVLFSEEQMPTSVLRKCQKAIEERQNVVHNGKREVQQIAEHLEAIREICSILSKYQEDDAD